MSRFGSLVSQSRRGGSGGCSSAHSARSVAKARFGQIAARTRARGENERVPWCVSSIELVYQM